MSILLSLLLAQARVLPEIDRRALDLQARAEAQQTRRAKPLAVAQAPLASAATIRSNRSALRTAAVSTRQPQTLPSPRKASGGALGLTAITTICRAAGNHGDPAAFLATLSRVYSLGASESGSLRTSCAAYLAGRADARTSK